MAKPTERLARRTSSAQVDRPLAAVVAVAIAVVSVFAPGGAGGAAAAGGSDTEAAKAGGRIVVDVKGVVGGEGQLLVTLWNAPDAWLKEDKVFRVVKAALRPGPIRVTFEGVPSGTYGAVAVHDRNGNGRLDMKYFPLPRPSEGTGCSRGAKSRFGPPKWKDAQFTLSGASATEAITVEY